MPEPADEIFDAVLDRIERRIEENYRDLAVNPSAVASLATPAAFAALEEAGMVVVSAGDVDVAVRMIGNEAYICGDDCGSPYCTAWQRLRAALPERTEGV